MAAPRLLIIGSGSQARYAIDIAAATKQKILGLVDIEKKENVGRRMNGVKIVATLRDFPSMFKPPSCRLVIAYGRNGRKKEIAETCRRAGYHFVSLISPLSSVSPFAAIGEGCIVNPFAVVMPNAAVGSHVVLHSHSVVEHDNVIGDYANLAPGVSLAGRVTIGAGAYIFTGAAVIPGVTIGAGAVVAAGAVVTSDVPPNQKVAGVPARRLGRA